MSDDLEKEEPQELDKEESELKTEKESRGEPENLDELKKSLAEDPQVSSRDASATLDPLLGPLSSQNTY